MRCLHSSSTPSTVSARRSCGHSFAWRSSLVGLSPCCRTASGLSRDVDRGAQANAHIGSQASTAGHELRRASSVSQLTDELRSYARAAATTGRHHGNDAFLATCLRELSLPARLRRLRPRQIACVLRSLVRLGTHPGEEWLAELDAACYCHPGPFDPASATAVLQSLAALHAATAAMPQPAPSPAATVSVASTARRGTWGAQAYGRRPHGTAPAHSSPSHGASSPVGSAVQPAPFRFPHAVCLRLVQGGVAKYTFEQLAMLLQAFRRLGVPVDDELALAVGRQMAVQLARMAPGRRAAALRAVLGCGAGGSGSDESSGGSGGSSGNSSGSGGGDLV